MQTVYETQMGESTLPEVGKKYFVRSITDYWVGECVGIGSNNRIKLKNASWVAVTGRLSEFMKNGVAPRMEIEPIWHPIVVQYLAFIDWPHALFEAAV